MSLPKSITSSLTDLVLSGGGAVGLMNYFAPSVMKGITFLGHPVYTFQATCSVQGNDCVFLPQNGSYVVVGNNIMSYDKKSDWTGIVYKTLDDAIRSLIPSGQLFGRPPPVTLPPSTALATTSAPSTTSAPTPPSTEAPLIQPWEGGDYTPITPNDTAWEQLKDNDQFKPIIVDTVQSNQNKLLYKVFKTDCDLIAWESKSYDCDHLTNPKFKAFKSFKDAFEFISTLPETTAPGSTATSAPAPGGGKRTKKKGKRQTHKKHTRRHRRRAVN